MIRKIILTLLLLVSMPSLANAQSLVIGDGGAKQCYLSVRHGDPGKASTIRDCKKSLVSLDLSTKDRAATHVNLGILYMRGGHHRLARINYDKAISMTPDLPEAHINNAAALIYMGEYQPAIDAINTAIDLGTTKMPEALYNRAMAYDHLKQYTRAYKDLQQALILRPDWPATLRALDNYEVISSVSQ